MTRDIAMVLKGYTSTQVTDMTPEQCWTIQSAQAVGRQQFRQSGRMRPRTAQAVPRTPSVRCVSEGYAQIIRHSVMVAVKLLPRPALPCLGTAVGAAPRLSLSIFVRMARICRCCGQCSAMPASRRPRFTPIPLLLACIRWCMSFDLLRMRPAASPSGAIAIFCVPILRWLL